MRLSENSDGHPYGYPSALPGVGTRLARLLFASNGGMYHPDNSPVGLYIEEGRELVRANTRGGPGNFHMRPNGVFYLTGEVAEILETRSFYLNHGLKQTSPPSRGRCWL